MTPHEYRKIRPGARVRLKRTVHSKQYRVPAGTEGTVTGKFKGCEVTFDGCDACGVQVRMTRIPAGDLVWIKE